jgi:hypothetical protein
VVVVVVVVVGYVTAHWVFTARSTLLANAKMAIGQYGSARSRMLIVIVSAPVIVAGALRVRVCMCGMRVHSSHAQCAVCGVYVCGLGCLLREVPLSQD